MDDQARIEVRLGCLRLACDSRALGGPNQDAGKVIALAGELFAWVVAPDLSKPRPSLTIRDVHDKVQGKRP